MSDSLRPHGLQHTRLPCPSLSLRVCSDLCPLSQWCCLTISSSVALFSSCLQSFPESGSFPMSRLFSSGGQSIGTSISASVLPMNIQGWFHLRLASLISLLSELCLPPFSIWNQSVVPCKVLTVASWPAYRFLRIQVRWSGIPISLRIFHSLLWSTQRLSNSQWSRSRFFLEFPSFLYDPTNDGNLIFGSFAFSKPTLYTWKFSWELYSKYL